MGEGNGKIRFNKEIGLNDILQWLWVIIAGVVFLYGVKFKVDAMEVRQAHFEEKYIIKEVYDKDIEHLKGRIDEILQELKDHRKAHEKTHD